MARTKTTVRVLARNEEADAFKEVLASPTPWRKAREFGLSRTDYRAAGEILEPGVTFFVMALEALGAQPKYSCEGHPHGFYVAFHASYELAIRIARVGYFTVELSRQDYWAIRHSSASEQAHSTEREKNRALEWAAAAWVKGLFPPSAQG